MIFSKRVLLLFLLLFCNLPITVMYAAQRPRFGGNLKVAEDLIAKIPAGEYLDSKFPTIVSPELDVMTVDFSALPEDKQIEVENYFEELKNSSHRCHWILDYPYFNHTHHNSLIFDKGKLVFQSREADILPALQSSTCFQPDVASFLPFRSTQYGLEANTGCVSGRPFVDSITPVAVDTQNPYLSFKLNDVDVFAVPEERFHQVSGDPELGIIPGPLFFVFLKTSALPPDALAALKSSIHANDLNKSVFNNHAEVLLESESNSDLRPGGTIYLAVPEENPFHLLGERLRFQMSEEGFQVIDDAKRGAFLVELLAVPMIDSDPELLRYQVLRGIPEWQKEATSFEIWDELISSGRLIPLFAYRPGIAVRKNVMALRMDSGALDFSNAWILPLP